MPEFITIYCNINAGKATLNGKEAYNIDTSNGLGDGLKQLYRATGTDYPKFFKMDNLCKLGFLAGEMIMKEAGLSQAQRSGMGIFMCNSTASLDTDLHHEASIADRLNFVPSPSVFVYTLPNILIGELAIRHKICGENTFLIFDKFETDFTQHYASLLLDSYGLENLLLGWVDVLKNEYRAFLSLISRNGQGMEGPVFSPENLMKAYQNKLD